MASCVVAVAGGTGKLGRAIVDELVAHGGYKVFVLGREVSHFSMTQGPNVSCLRTLGQRANSEGT
jgi:uncharacterized protein YbjT (DUF2867 family)